ncbi:S-protein homolog 5-like [Silene latifolia]|uniref:S-protein homolog 5-like n=1 Tax=Silene latifolia TaxID=37657 RepID=UPI003D76ACC3
MTNKLDGNKNVKIHCKDKHKDLGEYVIGFNGLYEFTFKPPFIDTSLYFCSFVWDNKVHWFDIYDVDRDKDDCFRFCWWSIHEDGPCKVYGVALDSPQPKDETCYKWNKDVEDRVESAVTELGN